MHRLSFPDFLFEPFKSCYTSIITMYSITHTIDLPLQADFLLWLPACKQPVHLGDRRSDSWTDTSCWGTFTRTFCGFCPSLSQTVTSALLPPGDWWKHRIRHRVQYSRCDSRYAPRISSRQSRFPRICCSLCRGKRTFFHFGYWVHACSSRKRKSELR